MNPPDLKQWFRRQSEHYTPMHEDEEDRMPLSTVSTEAERSDGVADDDEVTLFIRLQRPTIVDKPGQHQRYQY